jgi:hypothetical protein
MDKISRVSLNFSAVRVLKMEPTTLPMPWRSRLHLVDAHQHTFSAAITNHQIVTVKCSPSGRHRPLHQSNASEEMAGEWSATLFTCAAAVRPKRPLAISSKTRSAVIATELHSNDRFFTAGYRCPDPLRSVSFPNADIQVLR